MSSIISIRPHKLFALAPEDTLARMVHLKIPRRTENWTIETMLLITAMRASKARRIFEFGTFRGATTLNLAMNALPGAEIFTFDIDPRLAPQIKQDDIHARIMHQHLETPAMEFEGIFPSIQQIHGESKSFDAAPYAPVDFVFVDGGHDAATLEADSRNAFKLCPKGVIAWHDYGNREYPDVEKHLERLAFSMTIFHVEESRLCFWFSDEAIQQRLAH